jgi:hypothetical protein
MLYVIATLHEDSSWSLGARLYLRALATTELPFRLLWTARCSATADYSAEDVPDDAPRGGILHSFGDIFDPSQLPPALRLLRPRIGPGFPPQTPSAMLFVGEVDDAAMRISTPDECPQKNILLTSWPADTIPLHRAAQLNGYDLIMVPEGEGKTFRDAALPNVVEVPWPEPLPGDVDARSGSRVVQSPPKHVTRLLLAAGSWTGEDNVSRIADAFIANFRRSDGVGLVLACPDVPNSWISAAAVVRDKSTLPFIHVTSLSVEDPTCLDGWALAAHAYLDASSRVCGAYWRRRVASLGCPVIDLTEGMEPCPHGVSWLGASTSQRRRALVDVQTIGARMREQRKSRRLVARQAQAGEMMADLLRRALAGETFIATTQNAAPVKDGIAVVIPFMGESAEQIAQLRSCLAALKKAVRTQDRVVVSVRGATAAAAAVCKEENVACLHNVSGGEGWNISAARNAGWLWTKLSTVCAFVAFVDADVAVPEDYLKRLAREAYKRPGMVLTPYVVDRGSDVTKTARIASGMSLYPVELIDLTNGFPEDFVGWGHEDIALLTVLREQHGIPSVPLPNAPPGVHTPHEVRAGYLHNSEAASNLARLEDVQRKIALGEDVMFNEDVSSGLYHVVFAARG